MSNDARTTQFAGFAKALLTKIDASIGNASERMERGNVSEKEFANELGTMIACAAYDLVEHAIETANYNGISGWIQGKNIPLFHKVVQSIPDMAALPEEQAE